MADELQQGDRVSWSSHGRRARGEVVRKLTSTTAERGHTAEATADDPQYLVRTFDGREAAHHRKALRRLPGPR
jgi:hypothetical protein